MHCKEIQGKEGNYYRRGKNNRGKPGRIPEPIVIFEKKSQNRKLKISYNCL